MDASFEIALRSPGIRALGFDPLGILEHDPQDRLADLGFLREPAPTEGPA